MVEMELERIKKEKVMKKMRTRKEKKNMGYVWDVYRIIDSFGFALRQKET